MKKPKTRYEATILFTKAAHDLADTLTPAANKVFYNKLSLLIRMVHRAAPKK